MHNLDYPNEMLEYFNRNNFSIVLCLHFLLISSSALQILTDPWPLKSTEFCSSFSAAALLLHALR